MGWTDHDPSRSDRQEARADMKDELLARFEAEYSCVCHDAYKSRGLEEPSCWYHDFKRFLESA